jgi:hypothetical protein
MHNTSDCHCYLKDGKPLEAAADKPSKSKKPRKKFWGNKSMAFMQTMFEAYAKAKKASKSKKCKKPEDDSSGSSNSEYGTGCNKMGFSVDKHLKLDKPIGTVYIAIDSCSLKHVIPQQKQ